MFKIAICDDNGAVCAEIEKYLLEYKSEKFISVDIEVFNHGEELLEFIKNKHEFDLIFLDIELGTTTGVAVSKSIRNEFDDHISKIVFISAKDGYEMELFEVQPLNFLKKPLIKSDIFKCVDLSIRLLDTSESVFTYRVNRVDVKVKYDDILYFEANGKRIKIVSFDKTDYFYSSLNDVKKTLPEKFFSPHSSFLVNYQNIKIIGKDCITLMNDEKIPISQRHKKTVQSFLKRGAFHEL